MPARGPRLCSPESHWRIGLRRHRRPPVEPCGRHGAVSGAAEARVNIAPDPRLAVRVRTVAPKRWYADARLGRPELGASDGLGTLPRLSLAATEVRALFRLADLEACPTNR